MKFMVKDKRIQGLRVHCMSIGIFTTMQYIQKYLIKPLHLVATDSILVLKEDRKNVIMTNIDFEFFKKYHLVTCENSTLQGLSFHLLYIGKKGK